VAKLKISKFSGEISSLQAARLEALALYKPACSTAFARYCVLKSYKHSEVEQNGMLKQTAP